MFFNSLSCSVQGILGDALKCLGDNKKVVREAVIKMLDAWVLLLQLDKMVSSAFLNVCLSMNLLSNLLGIM